MPLDRIDVVCRIVDNFGDAGFCWRLARQLAAEHGLAVRIWIDALAPLARIAPIDMEPDSQRVAGVEILRLRDGTVPDPPPDVVVAGFGCALPETWLDTFERSATPPLWIHLEYLSAEPWIDASHGLPSPPPRRALRRWFYFPGFTPASGGLLREGRLFAERDDFLSDPIGRAALWRELGLAPPADGEVAVSLFCYPNPALPMLLDALAADPAPVRVVVPEQVAAAEIGHWAGRSTVATGRPLIRGSLTLAIAPFVPQAAYDQRLWSCDLNVVRGEDSFVRAQWAARPLVWQPYRQDARAHEAKLEAFLARYRTGAAEGDATALASFARAFCGGDGPAVAAAWPALRSALPGLDAHARRWASTLAEQPDLATRLVEFARKRL